MENQTQTNMEKLHSIDKTLKHLNRLRMSYAKRNHGKTKMLLLKRQIRKLRKQKSQIYSELSVIGFKVDLSSYSVKPLSTHKKRYLKTKSKYYNDKNMLVAIRGNQKFRIDVSKSQITYFDLLRLQKAINEKLNENVVLLTDNRHKFAIRVSKKITMQTERIFSQIKKPIYPQLKGKRKLTWKMVKQLYDTQFKRLGIENLN